MEEGSTHKLAFYSERMDVSALPKNRYFEAMRNDLTRKYKGQSIDLIIAVQYRALKFLIQHGEELWPNVPIIFCGLEEGRKEQLKHLRPNITGIFGNARFDAQIDTIFRIHPETNQIFVVVGASGTERFIEKRVRQTLPESAKRVEFTYLNEWGLDEILERVANLSPGSIVLFLTFIQDAKGKPVPENSLPLISKASKVPVYGLFDVYVGHGIVGGTLYSVEDRAIRAGKLGVRILAGENPKDIPMVSAQKHFNLYDWRELERWGIPEHVLPPGSVVRYRPLTFYNKYKWHIWGAVGLIVVQSFLISILLISRSKRRRTERRLKEVIASRAYLQEEVKHLDRVATMGSLTAAIAHEIGQPLTAILSNAQAAKRFLNKEQPDLKEIEEALDDIAINDKRAAEVIQRLRNLLKKTKPKFEVLNLKDVTSEVVDLVKSETVLIGASVLIDVRTDMPMVYGDRIQIQQVILNLLVNALHAVKNQPEKSRKIRMSTTVEGNDILFKVSDSGPGIEKHKLDTIFDTFHTTKASGMGLGLYICKSIVELHDGRIWAENRARQGAVITFSLPNAEQIAR